MCLNCLELFCMIIWSILTCQCFRPPEQEARRRPRRKKPSTSRTLSKSKEKTKTSMQTTDSTDPEFGKYRAVSEISEKEFRDKFITQLADDEDPEDFLRKKNYILTKDEAGSGTYGHVFKGFRQKVSGEREPIAIKVMNISGTLAEKRSTKEVKGIKREVYSLDIIKKNIGSLKHDNIVTIFDNFLVEYKDEQGDTCMQALICMELAEQDLGQEISTLKAQKIVLTNDKAKVIFVQMVNAVYFLHGLGIAHRDIKLENFLVFSRPGPFQDKVIKLTDFGLSGIYYKDEGGYVYTTRAGGTNYYKAPEILRNEIQRNRHEINHYSGDIYAMGVCLFRLLTNEFPFTDFSDKGDVIRRQENRILSIPEPKVTKYAKDLIFRLLEPNPNIRPIIFNVRRHPWLEGEVSLTLSATA